MTALRSALCAASITLVATFLPAASAMADPPIPNLPAPTLYANPDPEADVWEWFHNYRMQHFLPDTDPQVKAFVGNTQSVPVDSLYLYQSYYSASVGWSTALPAVGAVEYGLTSNYGTVTGAEDFYYYNHLRYLTGLQPDTVYHYRLLYKGADGVTRASADKTLRTKAMTPDVVRIPEDMPGGAPYQLSGDGKTYLVTQDITADATAIIGLANPNANVTLDLGGHTVTYDNAGPGGQDNPLETYGVKFGHPASHVTIANGSVVQGAQGSAGNPDCTEHMGPVALGECHDCVVEGLTLRYRGDSLRAISVDGASVNHNVIYDLGTFTGNRHQGSRIIFGTGDASFNSARRARQMGIAMTGDMIHNEIYIDSYTVNSIGIAHFFYATEKTYVKDNYVFGLGFNPQGYAIASYMDCVHNLAYMHIDAPFRRELNEYGYRLSGGGGFRYTDYGGNQQTGHWSELDTHDALWENNTAVVKVYEEGMYGKAFWLSGGEGTRSLNNVLRGNVMKAELVVDPEPGFERWSSGREVTALEVSGAVERTTENRMNDLLMENNRLIGNYHLIELTSSYGVGGGILMASGNSFERINSHDSMFLPIRLAWYSYPTNNNRIIDPIEGVGVNLLPPQTDGVTVLGDPAASPDVGTGEAELSVIRTLDAVFKNSAGQALANTTVNVYLDGRAAGTIKTDASGRAKYQVLQGYYYRIRNGDWFGTGGSYRQIGFSAAAGVRVADVKKLNSQSAIVLSGTPWPGSAGALNSADTPIKPVSGAVVWPAMPGTYRIHGGLDAYVLEVRNGVVGTRAATVANANQYFDISYTADGYAVLKFGGKALTLGNATSEWSHAVALTDVGAAPTPAQQWWIGTTEQGTFKVQNRAVPTATISLGRPGWLGDAPIDESEWSTFGAYVHYSPLTLEAVALPNRWPAKVVYFSDVPVTQRFYLEITNLVQAGIVSSSATGGGFWPDRAVTRGEMAAYLYRMAGAPAFSGPAAPSFTDVPKTHMFYSDIEWLKQSGITTGAGNGKFLPDQAATRGEVAAFLHRLDIYLHGFRALTVPAPSYADVPRTHTFFSDIEWMRAQGIAAAAANFNPSRACARDEMAAFLWRYLS
ncbi:MAG: S-layer homology domain-containing protein [Propionibacteriaceae bacterium]|jgi:hypothetical protein|nr:S-layer homology domain-containing protein [Propionibacteriaceae bacterium]